MRDTIENLRHKIERATDLESVVSTMKALAASNIGQYENAVRALVDYYYTVELGLWACLNQVKEEKVSENNVQHEDSTGVIVFGSDQGLVGQFNDVLAEFVSETLHHFHGKKMIWAVGERMHARLMDMGFTVTNLYEVPNSVSAITPLIGTILLHSKTSLLYIFHNRPTADAQYEPVRQRLLPLDKKWHRELMKHQWPTHRLPEILGNRKDTLTALMREYLFVSLFKACTESLASENSSRLAAMQRAEKNINEMLDELKQTYHRLRQSTIDNELFDVISGFEALRKNTNLFSFTDRL